MSTAVATRAPSTLKGIFGNSKVQTSKRNFIQENVRNLREMQMQMSGSKDGKVPKNKSVKTIDQRNMYEIDNVATKPCYPKASKQYEEEQLPVTDIVSSTDQIIRVTTNKKLKNKVNSSQPRVAEYVQQQQNWRNVDMRSSATNLTKSRSVRSSNDSYRPPSVPTLKNTGCQTVDPNNLDKLYNEGTIRYPSARNAYTVKPKNIQNDTEKVTLKVDNNSKAESKSAAGDTTPSSGQKSTKQRSEHGTGESCNKTVPKNEISPKVQKVNALIAASQKKTSSSDPLRPPPSYQRGVVPKYLRYRQDLKKAAEDEQKKANDLDCPPGHVPLPENERRETLRMLRKNYAEMVHELNMMPIGNDSSKTYRKKVELEKQLNKLEEGIKVFSRQKVYVRVGY